MGFTTRPRSSMPDGEVLAGRDGPGGVRLRSVVAAYRGGSLEERESIERILGSIDVALAIPGVLRKDAGFHQRVDCVTCRLTSWAKTG